MTRRSLELLEVISVGLPFCAFKILTGTALAGRSWFGPIGWFLVLLGCVDLLVNLTNVMALAAGRPRALGVCLTQIAVQWGSGSSAWGELGVALDVMLSFVLVALVIGFNVLPTFGRFGLQLWNVAVILNVLGAGIGRVSSSIAPLKSANRAAE